MPTMQLGVKHTQVNAAELAKQIEYYRRKREESVTAYLERVSAMPGQGVTSMFNFGTSYGIVQGLFGYAQIPLVMVRPNAWKKAAGLIGKPKDACRTLMQQLYPEQELGLKKHIGRADALAIARFGFLC
jgi:crossover junction endodeoxyribonuclease RuvC